MLLDAKPSPYSLIFYSLLVIGGLFYNLSLEHGIDVEWIHRKLFYLSSMLLLSSSSFLAATAMLLYYPTFPTVIKLGNFAVMLFWIFILFLQDTGNTIQYHGGYNILCFLIVTVPALLFMIFIRTIIRLGIPVKPKHFVYATVAFSVVLGLRLLWVRDNWVKGLSGDEFQASLPECNIPAPTYNWGEVPPYRGINFWTGSTKCPVQKELATYDRRTGKLTINEEICGQNAIVQVLPRTDNFTFDEKIDANFQKNILSRIKEVPVSNPMYLQEEAVLVNCGESSNLFVRNVKKQTETRKSSEKLSVLVIYLDAVSRRHFYRRFPKTVKLLEDLNAGTTHQAFQFFKYNAVGMITVKNAPGLFTGATFHQSWVPPNSIDPIWQKYKNSSYVTAVIDNSCLDWSARYQGKLSTVDHQFVAPFCLEESHPSGDPHSGLNGPFSIRRRCMRGKYVHSYVFDYLQQFWDNYAGLPRFALAMFNEGHEGTGDVIGLVDDDLHEFLSGEYESGGFDNTAVFFLADHGLHMGPFYMFNAYSAKLENHLPLFNAVFPRKFLDENPRVETALRYNKDQMFTGIDIFETLSHIMDFPTKPEPVSEGTSLLEPLIRGDTCEDAHIPEEFCVCK